MAKVGGYGRRSAAQWQALVQECDASGISQRAFCERRGLALSTFCQWRRRLEREAGGAGEERPVAPSGLRLIPVRVLDEAPASGASGLAVVVGGGVRIELACDFDGTTLKRLLATLQERA